MEMPEGTYFVGDPCYAIPEDEWDEYVNQYLFAVGSGGRGDVGVFKNRPVFAAYTFHGDGSYEGTDGDMYGVDSGALGVTPIELATRFEQSRLQRFGSIKTFDKPFDVFEEDGMFFIEDFVIDSNGEHSEGANGDLFD